MPKDNPKLPDIYFDLRSGGYLMQLVPNRFMPVSSSDVKAHLQLRGIHTELKNDQGLSYGNEILAKAQIARYVDYAGPLAGYRAGFQTMPGGARILVTRPFETVEAARSPEMPAMEKFFGELFGGQQIQIEIFFSWLKVGYESLLNGEMMPGQLLGLVGQAGCGKSFLQWIITNLFGGRSARPYDYMTGKTNFNEDLAKAEHLVMGDEEASYDIRSRKKFAAQIKQFCVEPLMRVHGKGKEAFNVETFRRLSAGVNDEPEHMLFFPPFDSDMKGKITLLKCSPAELDKDRSRNQKRFLAELPNLACALRLWKIPRELRDKRFGVVAWQHPELLEIVDSSTPETQLLTIIDEVIFTVNGNGNGNGAPHEPDDYWKGSAEQLKVRLLQSPHTSTVSRLLDYPAACGWYLARLKQKFPARFETRRSHGKTGWIIRKETDNALTQ